MSVVMEYGRAIEEYLEALDSLKAACDNAASCAQKLHHVQKRLPLENGGLLRMALAIKDHTAMKNAILVWVKRSKQTFAGLQDIAEPSKVNTNGRK